MRLQPSSGCTSDAISEAEKGSEAVSSIGEAEVWAEQEENTERMWEPDKGQRRERGQESRRAMEDKEDGGASLFPHQFVDFAPVPAPAPA